MALHDDLGFDVNVHIILSGALAHDYNANFVD